MKLFKSFAVAVIVMCIASFAMADAANKDLDPTFTGETGLFTIYSGDTLPKGLFTFGLVYQNFDRETKDFDTNVFNVVFGIGVTDNLELAASFAPVTQVVFRNWADSSVLNSHPYAIPTIENGMGDARLGLKYRLLDEKGAAPSIALRLFAKFPLADEAEGFGTGEWDFGGTLIVSKTFSPVFEASANLGYTMVTTPETLEVLGKLSNELNWGAGFGWTIDPKMKLKFMAEVKGITYTDTGDDYFEQAAPMDIFVGLQKRFKLCPQKDLRIGVGYQVNAAFDTDMANNPHGAGVMLTVGPSRNDAPEIRDLKPGQNATCVNSPVTVTSVAVDTDGDQLMYRWKANGKPLSGTDSNITWTPTSPGDYTITVTVNDGRRAVATQDTAIKVYPPPTIRLSVNADTVYATKKYTVTAAITNPGDYPLTYNWSVDKGSISPMSNQAEATWDLSNADGGAANVKLQVKSKIGCDVTKVLKVDVQQDPCLSIKDEDVAGEVYFPLNKYELREPTEESYKLFDRVIEKMKVCESLVILFEGHCCILGTEQYNMCLGWWRTETVVKYFVEHGISRDRIKTISYGKSRPKFDNKTEKTRQWNRRVEVKKDTGDKVPVGAEKEQFIEKCKKRYKRWLK